VYGAGDAQRGNADGRGRLKPSVSIVAGAALIGICQDVYGRRIALCRQSVWLAGDL
jgi:hypothetical protein